MIIKILQENNLLYRHLSQTYIEQNN